MNTILVLLITVFAAKIVGFITDSADEVKFKMAASFVYSRGELLSMRYAASCNPGRLASKKIDFFIRPRGSSVKQKRRIHGSGVNFTNLIRVNTERKKKSTNPGLSPSHSLNCSYMNCRSVCNKTAIISEYVLQANLDILFMTESWLSADDSDSARITELVPPTGYSFLHMPRASRGGGVAIILRDTIKARKVHCDAYKSFELLEVHLTGPSTTVIVSLIYRPPPNSKNKLSVNGFIEEFAAYLDTKHAASHFFCIGDFNFHLDDVNCPDARKYRELLDSFDLKQLVSDPTHKLGHIIDHIITRSNDSIVSDISVQPIHSVSDHYPLFFSIMLRKSVHAKRKSVHVRNMKTLSISSFASELSDKLQQCALTSCVDDQTSNVFDSLKSVLDNQAPLRSRRMPIRDPAPWFNEDVSNARRERRTAELAWRSSKLEIHRDLYKQKRNYVVHLIQKVKKEHLLKLVEDCHCDQKRLFGVVDKLLGKDRNSLQLPSHEEKAQLAERFNVFFSEKVQDLCNEVSSIRDPDYQSVVSVSVPDCPEFSMFCPVQPDVVARCMKLSPPTSCRFDPVPTSLLLKPEILSVVLPVITNVFNLSFTNGKVPDSFKIAAVKPLLKKVSLDHEVLKNYRPVSNLTFLSKIQERLVTQQFTEFICKHNLADAFQSAYRPGHSTETALLRVCNDILMSLNGKRDVFLVLLDLSAAFDTVNHELLLERLRSRFNVTGLALEWFRSYLTDRMQHVIIENNLSTGSPLSTGVPQGAVLGPTLFSVYTAPLGDIMKHYNVDYHLYADDTQLYMSFSPGDGPEALARLEACIAEVRAWMAHNFLCLNDDKTEFLRFSSRPVAELTDLVSVCVGGSDITVHFEARNLGVILDSALSMKANITAVCRSVRFHLRRIGSIRKYLTKFATEQLVHSLTTSRLDYCNSLYSGIADNQIHRLQLLQNTAARIVTRTRSSEHITPVLRSLHWLPVKFRIDYKIIVMTFKALHGLAPAYLMDLIEWHSPGRALRSMDRYEAKRKGGRGFRVKTGERAFEIRAPQLWNSLPLNIRKCNKLDSFKRTLKTHLFKCAFN